MISLVERIRHGDIWDFPGGIHPPENKVQSTKQPIATAGLPQELVLPVKQHIGRPGDLAVKVGDKVLKGQQLTRFTASFMLPVHAPTSGEIIAIEPRRTAHPSGLTENCVILKPDGKDEWCEKHTHPNFEELPPEELIEEIRQAGVAGLGGAGFPTARKIQSGMAKTEVLIINAAECEPYITADDMLMREYAEEIIQGIGVLEHILKPELVVIAVEDNKPEAIKALQGAALNRDLVIRAIPTKYPSGGEKQLIKLVTNREVPKEGIPADIGVLVQNVGSVFAIKRAIIDGEPLIERVVTLTGNCFSKPQNVWVRLGTPVDEILSSFGYKADKRSPRIILGGPMMGFTLPSTDVPVTKTTNCILAPTRKEIAHKQHEVACIRCGQCAEVCPASLLPQQLFWYSKDKDLDKCEELNIADCIECGSCAYVCPSEIPLVHYYRQAKAEIRINEQETEAAERAKARFEEKKARMERDKAERENRFKKAASDRRKEMKKTGDDDAVAAAIARVKAQKESAKPESAVKPAVAAAIARAKAKQAEAMKAGDAEPDNEEMIKLREERKRLARERKAEKDLKSSQDESAQTGESAASKKDAVAAAVARAKARKAKQADAEQQESAPITSDDTEQATESDSVQDKKKAAIAAAVARAKSKKAKQAENEQQESAPEPSDDTEQVTKPDSVQDKKKAAVAAAVARAKARKAKQAEGRQQESAPEPSDDTEQATESESVQDKKKAAVAAAVARAKARKAKQAEAGQQESAPEPSDDTEQDTEPESVQDKKKAAVAAAVARAKARKAKQAEAEQQESAPEPSDDTEQDTESESVQDKKKAAVAAAVARAKARKAAKENEAKEKE